MNRSELKRLKKAASSSNPIELGMWASSFEQGIRQEFEQRYQNELIDSIETYSLATAYTLHYVLNLGKKRLPEVMERIWNNVDSFRTGHLSPLDCMEELEQYGIYIKPHEQILKEREKERENGQKSN